MSGALNRKQRRAAAQATKSAAGTATPASGTGTPPGPEPAKAQIDAFLQSVDIDPVVIRMAAPAAAPKPAPAPAPTAAAPDKPAGPAPVTLAPVTLAPVTLTPVTLAWGPPAQVTWRPGLTLGAVLPALQVTPAEAEIDLVPPRSTPLGGGDIVVTATVRDTARYAATPATLTLPVVRAQPSILWDAPEPQPHATGGFKLTGAQLNAVASPGAGPATYAPADGAVLAVGKHGLKVTFAESPTHASATQEVEFEVRKASCAISWPPPSPVDFVKGGFKLTGAELSAVTAPPGVALAFKPAAGSAVDAGRHALLAEVADAAANMADPATVMLEVCKAKPVITWATPAVQILGANNKVRLVANAAPLDAKCTEGESDLVYTPAAGADLTPGTKGGPTNNQPQPPLLPKTYVITATHAESANYEFAQSTVTLTVAPTASAKEGFETANAGDKAFNAASPLDATVKDAWDKDLGKVKTQATEIIAALPNMTTAEMIAYMDKLADVANNPDNYQTDEIDTTVTPNKTKMYYNKAWKLPNGLQIRLKPNGDPFTNPHLQNPRPGVTPPPTIPMFAVEIRKPSKFDFAAAAGAAAATVAVPTGAAATGAGPTGTAPVAGTVATPPPPAPKDEFSDGGADTATKVTAGGNLGPWGPGQTTDGGKSGAALQQYMDATTQATHHQCRATKKTQIITCDASVTLPHGTKLDASALRVRLQPGDGAITLDPVAGTVLPIGTRPVKITAAASNGFAAATRTVSVTTEKARPRLAWKTPAPADYAPGGFVLTAAQLDAALTPAIAGPPVYTPPAGATLGAGLHTLRADVAATAEREAASATVTLEVRKATPTITLQAGTRQEAQPGAGVALAVADVVSASVPADLDITLDPPAGTMLVAGSYRVQARFAGDANRRAAAGETSFTVTTAPA